MPKLTLGLVLLHYKHQAVNNLGDRAGCNGEALSHHRPSLLHRFLLQVKRICNKISAAAML